MAKNTTRALNHGRSFSLRRFSAYVGFCAGVVAVAALLVILMFGGSILNGYGKARFERAFADAHPGCTLKIGNVQYALLANRMDAQDVTLSTPNATLRLDRLSLTGVRWTAVGRKTAVLADLLAHASLEATNLVGEFRPSNYGVRCARLRASVANSDLTAEGAELQPLVGDEDLFSAYPFRTTRFRVVVPECRILGLAYGELLQGKSYRATSVRFSEPSFEALVNRDKPVAPFAGSPLMVHEALAAIPKPLQVDNLSIVNGNLRYCERLVAKAEPGVLTFAAVNITAESIANQGQASAAIWLQAQANFMEAGLLRVRMTLPVTPSGLSLHYSGSLSAMDLTRLGAFLETAEHIRIKSGAAQEVEFDVSVDAGHARGRVRAIYKDLIIAVIDKQTGAETGLGNRIASLLANIVKIRNSNVPDASGAMKEGRVDYKRDASDTFLQFAWFALRTGVLDIISH